VACEKEINLTILDWKPEEKRRWTLKVEEEEVTLKTVTATSIIS
jgi:hypothetical protein